MEVLDGTLERSAAQSRTTSERSLSWKRMPTVQPSPADLSVGSSPASPSQETSSRTAATPSKQGKLVKANPEVLPHALLDYRQRVWCQPFTKHCNENTIAVRRHLRLG